MRSFEFCDGTPAEFVERVQGLLAARGLADHVPLRCEGEELVVGFR